MKTGITAALCAVLMLPACATVTRGSDTDWEVRSTPPGAAVHTSSGHHCPATPCSIRMPRKSPFMATLTLPGYADTTVAVTTKLGTEGSVALAGNVIIGGLIGVGVDSATGATLDLTPNPVVVTMRPAQSAPSPTRASPFQ